MQVNPGLRVVQEKYASRNPISRLLLENYMRKVSGLLDTIHFESALECGTGEGVLIALLAKHLKNIQTLATDRDIQRLRLCKANAPFASIAAADVLQMPLRPASFDLVLCCEVLEHLHAPRPAVMELARVTRRYCLITVPNEPIWRMLNLARDAYISRWGNTPGHVNHWTFHALMSLVRPAFTVVAAVRPLPWIALLCQKIT